MQLGLGTAQFGLDYGVSNARGRTPPAEVAATLALAAREGIDLLDTAALYGESEAALGSALAGHRFRIVTKTVHVGDLHDSRARTGRLREGFARSLERLRQKRVYGLLVHSVADLLAPDGEAIWEELTRLQRDGAVEKIGVSVYTPAEADAVLARFAPELVQLPVSIVDQRALAGGALDRIKARGIEVHARSILLQGLLLMSDKTLPAHLARFRPQLSRVWLAARESGTSPLALALAFLGTVPQVDAALLGVEDSSQLREALAAMRSGARGIGDCSAFACEDERLLNPSLWSQPTHA